MTRLDSGHAAFQGDARWLEIGVRPGDSDEPNDYVLLTPRQEVMPTPPVDGRAKTSHLAGGQRA